MAVSSLLHGQDRTERCGLTFDGVAGCADGPEPLDIKELVVRGALLLDLREISMRRSHFFQKMKKPRESSGIEMERGAPPECRRLLEKRANQ